MPSTSRVLVVTALPLEFKAVRAHLVEAREERHRAGTVFEVGRIKNSKAGWEVWICQAGTGNERAAMEVERGIEFISPDLTILCGVAGGIKDVKLGDVVFATKVYAYESGKITKTENPRPQSFPVTDALLHECRVVERSKAWKSIDNSPVAHEGPIAAGAKVIASSVAGVTKYIQKYYGDTLAVEMEGYGHMVAAHGRNVPALVIRGISDLLDGKTGADKAGWQQKAAKNAAEFLILLLTTYRPTNLNSSVILGKSISWEVIIRILNTMHRQIEVDFRPDIVLTMSGPGSFAACYCMSLDLRNTPTVIATTFPVRRHENEAAEAFSSIALKAGWHRIETSKWIVFLPNVLDPSIFSRSSEQASNAPKMLIFDDRVITGETQRKAAELFSGRGFEVRRAAMLADPSVANELDFVGERVAGDFYLPWGPKHGRHYHSKTKSKRRDRGAPSSAIGI